MPARAAGGSGQSPSASASAPAVAQRRKEGGRGPDKEAAFAEGGVENAGGGGVGAKGGGASSIAASGGGYGVAEDGDDASIGDEFDDDEAPLSDLDEDDLEGGGGGMRPLTPTAAIAAAFRRLQARTRRFESLRAEHAQCSARLRAAQQADERQQLQLQIDRDACAASIAAAAAEGAVLRKTLEQQQQRTFELESALAAARHEVRDGNTLLVAAREVLERQARGEAEALRRAWDEGAAAGAARGLEQARAQALQLLDADRAAQRQQQQALQLLHQQQQQRLQAEAVDARNELARAHGELSALRASRAGCARCCDFELPSEAELAAPGAARGPWLSAAAVRSALAEAAAVRLVVLAPTVRVALADGSKGGSGGGAQALLLAALPADGIGAELEREVLPRFAAAFAAPRLRPRRGELVPVAGGEGDFRDGPAGDSELDAWLRRLVARLEADVTDKLRGSEHFRVIGRVIE